MKRPGFADRRRIGLEDFGEDRSAVARGQKPPTSSSFEAKWVGGAVGHARRDSSVCIGMLCSVRSCGYRPRRVSTSPSSERRRSSAFSYSVHFRATSSLRSSQRLRSSGWASSQSSRTSWARSAALSSARRRRSKHPEIAQSDATRRSSRPRRVRLLDVTNDLAAHGRA